MPHNVPLSPTVRFSGVVEHWVFTQQTHTKGGTTASLQLQQETCAAMTRQKKKKKHTNTHRLGMFLKKKKKVCIKDACHLGFIWASAGGNQRWLWNFPEGPCYPCCCSPCDCQSLTSTAAAIGWRANRVERHWLAALCHTDHCAGSPRPFKINFCCNADISQREKLREI